MRHLKKITLTVMALTSLLGASLVAAAPTYSVVNIGDLGGGNTLPSRINEAGQVTGFSATAGNRNHAFLYDGTAMIDLTPGSLSFTNSKPINNAGQLIYADNATGQSFLYSTASGTATALNITGAAAINDAGTIAGGLVTSSTQVQAYLYSDGVQSFLPSLGGTYTTATAINNAGQVAGLSYLSGASGDYRAFLYDSTGMTTIGTFGGSASAANDINNLGQVVGYARTAGDAETHPFLFDSATNTLTDLGTLGTWLNNAYGMNDLSQVVGVAYVINASGNGGVHGTLYDSGSVYDLNNLIDPASGWTIESGWDINNAGQIIAAGFNSQLGIYNRALLLTPNSSVGVVPEPGSLALISVGLLGLMGYRRRSV